MDKNVEETLYIWYRPVQSTAIYNNVYMDFDEYNTVSSGELNQ